MHVTEGFDRGYKSCSLLATVGQTGLFGIGHDSWVTLTLTNFYRASVSEEEEVLV